MTVQINELIGKLLDYDTGRYANAGEGIDISFIKIGDSVTIMGFAAMNAQMKAVPLLPYLPQRSTDFSVVGSFNDIGALAGYGNGRVEKDNAFVAMWFNTAVTYARLNFTYWTDGIKSECYPNEL